MPPRHAYWTILIDNQPTAFRAHDPEELLPTLNRLREKNETAVMKWFERGQLFDSRDAARDAGFGEGERRWEGPRGEAAAPAGGRRDKSWRPGGEHRDPRQKYKDAKKAKWDRFKQKIRERHEQRGPRDPESFSPPHGDPLRDQYRNERQVADRDRFKDRDRYDAREQRPTERGPASGVRQGRFEDRDGAPTRPHGDKYRQARAKPDWRDRETERPRGPAARFDDRDRPPSRPSGDKYRQARPKPDWRDRDERPRGPARDRPRSTERPLSGDREGRGPRPRTPGGYRESSGWKPSGERPRKPFPKKSFGAKTGGRPPRESRPPDRRPKGPQGWTDRKRRRDEDE